MRHILRYLGYVVRHKFWVGVACFRAGLYWRGLKHDWSKLLPSEFFPYANFFGRAQQVRDKTGYYKPTDTGDPAFEMAWLRHARRNMHHWQWFALSTETGEKLYDMPDDDVLEMICDWWGAGKAQGSQLTPKEWYAANRHKMKLSPVTAHKIEVLLDELPFAH